MLNHAFCCKFVSPAALMLGRRAMIGRYRNKHLFLFFLFPFEGNTCHPFEHGIQGSVVDPISFVYLCSRRWGLI